MSLGPHDGFNRADAIDFDPDPVPRLKPLRRTHRQPDAARRAISSIMLSPIDAMRPDRSSMPSPLTAPISAPLLVECLTSFIRSSL
jgi:hypothetical protein